MDYLSFMFTQAEILTHFDPALAVEPTHHYPEVKAPDIAYHFWLDLEHGYFDTAGSRLHLYADEDRWAVVAEKSGYANRGDSAQIELNYFCKCSTKKRPSRRPVLDGYDPKYNPLHL